jgi:hypothetical protein
VGGTPELLTSFGDFQRIYGGLDDLAGIDPATNYVAHAARAFFDNGGAMLYVSRAFAVGTGSGAAASAVVTMSGVSTSSTPATPNVSFISRWPGSEGNGTIQVDLVGTSTGQNALASLPSGSVLRFDASGSLTYFVKQADKTFAVTPPPAAGSPPPAMPATGALLLTLRITATSASGNFVAVYERLGLDPSHPQWIGNVLAASPARRQDYLQNLFAFVLNSAPSGPLSSSDLVALLFDQVPAGAQSSAATLPINTLRRTTLTLTNGNDGSLPLAASYAAALVPLESLENISIVAAPGSSAYGTPPDATVAIHQELLKHVSRPRAYRVAVLDTPPGYLVSDATALKSELDSTYAALYYPWVRVANPLASANNSQIPQEINLPPSGFVTGIYARSDVNHGVFKAPANEVVLGAIRFERDVSFGEQGVLNPLGVNCLRSLPNRGSRVWGARTVSSDPDWKYISVRRYMVYLEASIDHGTQWAVFENNGPQLWGSVKQAVDSFLFSEWRSGALLGDNPHQAYFVKCDRSTMTQNDLDNGRMVCLIGVAVVKPAEFVIFRIGQKTADASS